MVRSCDVSSHGGGGCRGGMSLSCGVCPVVEVAVVEVRCGRRDVVAVVSWLSSGGVQGRGVVKSRKGTSRFNV